MKRFCYLAAALALAMSIFLFDALSPLEGAIAVLYVIVILLAARTDYRSDIIFASLVSLTLTIAAYVWAHEFGSVGAPEVRALVSLSAIAIVTIMALQNYAATVMLSGQARLLDLSHDMIFVRDQVGKIKFWNRTAADVYGWAASEARGKSVDELLHTQYSLERDAIDSAFRASGRWDGVARQLTRDGRELIVDTRWALQTDQRARAVGVMETHTDITQRNKAYEALVHSERRYRRMFDDTRIGVIEEDWRPVQAEIERSGRQGFIERIAIDPALLGDLRQKIRLTDVNPAFMSMIGIRDKSDFMATLDDVLGKADRTFADTVAAFARGDTHFEGETEVEDINGRDVPVLFTISFPQQGDGGSVLVFVVDISERKQAESAHQQARAELAHAMRVATLGELAASIAHEVNQPLMAMVTNAEAGLRWLRRDPPELREVESAVTRVVSEGHRASNIVRRIRTFLEKSPLRHEMLSVRNLIEEAAALIEHELHRAQVILQLDVAKTLPPVAGDRTQIQQILVNLMMNAAQAMTNQPGERRLVLRAECDEANAITISVRDNGPGISAENISRLFEPFFTTKSNGMGMGLAISRTIAEAHNGRLTVESDPGNGAVFRLTLPGADVLSDRVGDATA